MKRITPLQKKIADAHITAKQNNSFTGSKVESIAELKAALLKGDTYSDVLNVIEMKFTTVGSQLMASPLLLGHLSVNYKAGVYRGFKTLLTKLEIV